MSYKILLASLRQNLYFKRNFRICLLSMKDTGKTEVTENPVKFTTSDAAKWRAVYSTAGEDYFKTPRIQPLVVVLSLTAFMLYFCVYREENDLDEWLRDIEKRVPIQVEEAQLRVDIAEGRKQGRDVKYLETRYKAIQENKKL